MDSVVKFSYSHQSRFTSNLKDFIRFPSVSAQPKHANMVKDCSKWLAHHLQRIGLKQVKVFATPRHPIVYAESKQLPQRPTILIYGHYDVQPPDPLNEWHSPPFQPVVRGENLYGRGACDDKGQMFAHIKAIDSYLQTKNLLPVNVKCLFEGEEEIGSPNLPAFLAINRDRLKADVVVISDMRMVAPNRPAITYALRGALGVEIEVKGQNRDLHSGLFGGAVHNPLQVLCELIAALHDSKGKIAIPGFYDHVRSWSEDERDYMANVGPTDSELMHDVKVRRGWGELGYSAYERTTIRPALTVTGITGGYQGEGTKSIIPRRAVAKLDCRLVPDQSPREIERLFQAHIMRLAPPTVDVKVRTLASACPALINRKHPVMDAAVTALRKGFGAEPIFLRSGGAIPVVNMLQQSLDVPIVLMGFALPNANIHAPNENLHLPTFFSGIKTSISFLSEVGSRLKPRKRIQYKKRTLNNIGLIS